MNDLTSAGIGLTVNGVEINSYKGREIQYGKITALTIKNNGRGYKIPNNQLESLPILLIDGIKMYDTLCIYGGLVAIELINIPNNILTAFSVKPIIIIENHIDDVTGRGMSVEAIYTIDGNIIGFSVIEPGKYYTKIPYIYIIDISNPTIRHQIPISAIVVLGSIGVCQNFDTNQTAYKDFNPLKYTEIVSNSSIIYESVPTATILSGTGATATANIIDGMISSITILDSGINYNNPPQVKILDSTGVGATGICIIESGVIVAVQITNGGSNYSNFTYILFEEYGDDFVVSTNLETWTNNLAINPYVDNRGGYVYNYEDTFCEAKNVPDTTNYPQYVQLYQVYA